MAFKVSNQITFTEHKKIIEIQEWYLASNTKTGVAVNDTRWSRNIPSINSTNKYLWNYERTVYSLGEDDVSEPAIIGVYGDTGASGTPGTIALLTNENVTLSANSKGEVSATTFRTDVVAYSGTESTKVTLGNILGAPPGVSVDILYNNNTRTVVFTVDDKATLGSIDSCHGTIKIQVTSPIRVDLNLSWSKINSGADGIAGENAKHIKLNTTHHVLKVDKNGNFFPETITITPTVNDADQENLIWYFSKNGGKSFYARLSGLGITVWKYDKETDGYVEVPNHEELTQDHRSYVTIDCSTFKNNTSVDSIVVGLRNKNDTFKDLMTIYKISDGASAYTVFLTNENVSFNANSDGVTTTNITFHTNVVAYAGGTQTPVEVGTPIPSDTDIQIYDPTNDGDEISLSFSIDKGVQLDSDGTIKIPVTKPIPTNLILNWNVVKDGAPNPKNITLSTTSHIIKVDKNGNTTPSTITVTPTISTTDQNDEFLWDFSTDGGDPQTDKTGITIIKDDPGSSISIGNKSHITINTANLTLNKTVAIRFRTPDNATDYYEDVLTIHKVSDGENGSDGKGISNIINYYQVTTDTTAPTSWQESVPELTPTNKYLWNYEQIIYTDNTSSETDPAIIGAYGDSGDGMVTFEIYSPRGFIFKEDMQSIDLKIAAFLGNTAITNVTYKWEWWDDSLNNGEGGYVVIAENVTDDTFTVNKTDDYAFANLKCSMEYDGQTYEDYVSLMKETNIYTSVVKFFDGSNIFYSDDLYIVAYVELYQNNDLIETIAADTYCTGVSSISGDIISANVTGDFSEGDRMYFVCRDNNLYEVVLGEFSNGTWRLIDNSTNYSYVNSLYSHTSSNVIAISKESINKSQNIDFSVLKDGIRISGTSANVIDSNDPVISSSPPTNPVFNQLWLDTSSSPYVLKIYTQTDEGYGEWVDCTEQIGGSVFTSKPSTYRQGDLWILAEGESCDKYDKDGKKCGEYGPGSMLRAKQDSALSPMMAYLTNESVILAADSDGKVHGTTFSTDVVACSMTNLASHVLLGKITGLPRGVTYTTSSGLDGKQTITFTVADGTVLKNVSGTQPDENGNHYGIITIPVLSPVETSLKLKWTQVDGIYSASAGAKNIVLSASSQVIKVHEGGNTSPSTITITPAISNVESNELLYWRASIDGGAFESNSNGIAPYPGYSSFTVGTSSYVEINSKTLLEKYNNIETLSIKLRKRTDLQSLYYEDIITIHKLSHSSTFNAADWVDADEDATELKNNIKQYFRFDADDGLIIGQMDEKFFVNITSKEMGFYDRTTGEPQKVVSISNNAATIKNLTVEESATFDCDTKFVESVQIFSLVWQKEDNGSFSLDIVQ